ncbi:hypothetical protein LZ30DRAFT_704464 [Colletotrichum cereale]|nr:hypothetical protein LZ30DRAFT_704464 [Colletotrichum cereale]
MDMADAVFWFWFWAGGATRLQGPRLLEDASRRREEGTQLHVLCRRCDMANGRAFFELMREMGGADRVKSWRGFHMCVLQVWLPECAVVLSLPR